MTLAHGSLDSIATRFVAMLSDSGTAPESVYAFGAELLQATLDASPSDLAPVLSTIVNGCHLRDPNRSGFAAMCCGVLVERRASIDIAGEPIVKRLPSIIKAADAFFGRVRRYSESVSDEASYIGERYEECLDRGVALNPAVLDIATEFRTKASAYFALDLWLATAMVLLSMSAELRRPLREAKILRSLRRLAQANRNAELVYVLLRVLVDDAIVFLDIRSRIGYECRVSDVSSNFDLRRLVGKLQGHGEVSDGTYPRRLPNLYPWDALGGTADQPVVDPFFDFWSWQTSAPADIRQFEGQRIVIVNGLGYAGWKRMYAELRVKPTLTVVRTLDTCEVDDWLGRLLERR